MGISKIISQFYFYCYSEWDFYILFYKTLHWFFNIFILWSATLLNYPVKSDRFSADSFVFLVRQLHWLRVMAIFAPTVQKLYLLFINLTIH